MWENSCKIVREQVEVNFLSCVHTNDQSTKFSLQKWPDFFSPWMDWKWIFHIVQHTTYSWNIKWQKCAGMGLNENENWNVKTKNLRALKGQTNSKWFFQADVSSKKRMNKFVFTTCRLVFVHFFEESKDTKKTFRN